MKIIYPAVLLLLSLTACVPLRDATNNTNKKTDLQAVLKKLAHVDQRTILVAAHRGDWRNAPENSIQGLKNCINMGVDIVEFDLKITKDDQLVILHDNTLDRTTTGKGRPEHYTLAELKQLQLRDGSGHATAHTIPTLEEFLTEAKDKIVVCVDKGFPYFEQAMTRIKQRNMVQQVIFNVPNITLDSLKSLNLNGYSDDLMINVLGFPNEVQQARELASSYRERKRAIMHPTFASDTIPLIQWMPAVANMGLHLWINALWPEHNGGHHDDRAVDNHQPDETWGWLIDHGATIIQTDRPSALIQYLRAKGLHQ